MIKLVARSSSRVPLPEARASYTVREAFQYCEGIAHQHFDHFQTAQRFLPVHKRDYVWAIYAFARVADDYADEGRATETERLALLDSWENQLERAFHGEAEHPVFIALKQTIEDCEIPLAPLQDLLSAFRMDLSTPRYPTFEALERYTQVSAAPVGRVALYVFGYRDPALHHYADDLCVAFELAYLLAKIPAHLDRGRMYLPEEDLRHFGVTDEMLRSRQVTSQIRDLIRFEVSRARSRFERGRPLIDRVGRELGFEMALLLHAGMRLLDKVEATDAGELRHRVRLSAADSAGIVARAATLRWPRFTTVKAHLPFSSRTPQG